VRVYIAVMGFIYMAFWTCWPRMACIRYTGSCSPKC